MGLLDKAKQITEVANYNNALDKIKSIGDIKAAIVGKVVSIDYSPVIEHLTQNKNAYPGADILISSVNTVKEAAKAYTTSGSKCKESDFLLHLASNIDPEKVIKELEPIASLIPMGSIILLILKLLLKFKKNKQATPSSNTL